MSSLGRWVVEIFLLGVRGMEEGGKGCRIVRCACGVKEL